MSNNPITVRTFMFYVNHLRQVLKQEDDTNYLSNPFILMILDEKILNGKSSLISSYFENSEEPIKSVALALYWDLLQIYKDYPNNIDRTSAISEIELASMIKNVLRLIKYTCTIIDETTKKKSAFQHHSIIDVIQTDDLLRPNNWTFITYDQLMIKCVATFREDYMIAPICPITNYRLTDVFDIQRGFPKTPLFILNDTNYISSIKNLITKYMLDDESNPFRFHRGSHAETLYIGSFENEFPLTCTRSFEKLSKSIKDVLQLYLPNKYEIVLAVEYVPMKAYGVSVCFKLFIFEYVKDVGYVLNCYITGKITNTVSMDFFYTIRIPWILIEDILTVCSDFFKENTDSEEKHQAEDIHPLQSPNLKLYKLMEKMVDTFEIEEDIAPSIPELIIYP